MTTKGAAVQSAVETVRETIVALARGGAHPAHIEVKLAMAGLCIRTRPLVEALVREGRLAWGSGGKLIAVDVEPCKLCLSRGARPLDVYCVPCAEQVNSLNPIEVGDDLEWAPCAEAV